MDTLLPFDILPHELLIDVLALTRPNPQLAAASRIIASELSGTDTLQPARLSWIHRVVFSSPVPEELVTYEFQSHLFEHYAEVRQVQSRLSCFLKCRLPWVPAADVKPGDCPFACAMAPDAPLRDPILTEAYIDWLFAGPMRQCAALDHQEQGLLGKRLDELFVPVDTPDADVGYMRLYASAERAQSLKHLSWTLVPDAFHLVTYFIRAGQTDLLRHTLVHLLRILPVLATESYPLSRWVQLAMDNRYQVRSTFSYVRFDDDSPIPFALFLTTLAALDWFLPALQVIQDVLSFDPAVFVAWMTKWPAVYRGMMYTLHDCKSASRATRVLQWLMDFGFTYDVEERGDISTNAGDCGVFLELFHKFDVPKLAQLADHPHSRYYLGEKIVEWMASNSEMPANDQDQLLMIASEHDLLDSFGMGRLLWDACKASDAKRQDWVIKQVRRESLHDTIRVAFGHHTPDVAESTACQVATLLLNHIVDAGICPTQFLIDVWSSISTPFLAIIFFDSQPRTPLDLARFAVAWLNRLPIQPNLHETNRPNTKLVQLLGKLLLQVICKQHAANEPYLLADPSVDTQSLLCAVAVYLSHLILDTPHDAHMLAAQAAIVPNIMAISRTALATQLCAEPASDSPFNSNLVPCISNRFQASIRSITTTSTNLDLTMARSLFDQIHLVDPVFAKEHVCWSKDTCVWDWVLFSADEFTAIGPRLKYHHAVSAIRRAGAAGDKDSVAAILRVLPDPIRESRPFLKAMASLNATCSVVAAGLRECGWEWEAALESGMREG